MTVVEVISESTNVAKEIDHLKMMAVNWRRGYESNWLEPFTDNECAYREYYEEMLTYLFPYLGRLRETGYIDKETADDIAGFFLLQIELLMLKVREMEEALSPPVALWR